MVDIVVPAGEGPLELPEIELEQSAWYRRLGKPAPEIEAVDIEGKPVNLAEYRGKLVALVFWASTYEPDLHFLALRRNRQAVQGAANGRPRAACRITQLARKLEALCRGPGKTLPVEIDIRFLLDQPPVTKAAVRLFD